MNKFDMPKNDPIQDKFREKLHEQGVVFSRGKNAFLPAEDWFEKYFIDQTYDDLPKHLQESYTAEELAALMQKHTKIKNKKNEGEQLDLNFNDGE